MLKCFIALYFFVFSFCVFAYKPQPYSHQSFIISFTKAYSVEVLNELSGYRLTKFESLNPEHTIFKVDYQLNNISFSDAEQALYHLPDIQMIQEDGPVFLRSTVPNDSFISSQWHLSRIKAFQSWDLTRGGINRRGDTIVIAIVDDGLHIKHPDFKDNIWINYADTAGNGKDDDGNGYIDDHYGWNFLANNNDISDSGYYVASHGTPVSGIIGARGNNKIGVCGIMWNVKLMYANINDTSNKIGDISGSNFAFQSDVIRAYSYVLYQRKLYNATNGKKGAFVVATNSSWGVDKKFANQAPLWCSFYDTLGKYGILTSGATSNDLSPVDDSGDLPTLCQSQHLIMVNISDYNDQFVRSGYSATNVDLSAPGQSIFTTFAYVKQNIQNNVVYTNQFSGTSAAAPMVTGAIGLLHAYACEKMMDLIKSDPEKANLLMRRFILEGVDIVPNLAGRNATNGRLNILKSLQVMDEYCYGTLNNHKVNVMEDIVLFPNPGNGNLQIETNSPILKISCYDVIGRIVTYELTNNQIDITQLANGIYYFKIETENSAKVMSYVKQ